MTIATWSLRSSWVSSIDSDCLTSGSRLGARFREPAIIFLLQALNFGVLSCGPGAFEERGAGGVHAPAGDADRTKRQKRLLRRRKGNVADAAAASMVNLSFREYAIE